MNLFLKLVTLWLQQIVQSVVLCLDPLFDQISATTLAEMFEDVAYDCFFVQGALPRKMRMSGAFEPYAGGTGMQSPFVYDRLNGGFYAPGSDVQVTQKQVLAATIFPPRAYEITIPENEWQTYVLNGGPQARVSILDTYIQVALMSMETDFNVDMYNHGQAAPGGLATNRVLAMDGASEAMNNGTDNSWDGNVFTTYGGQTRNGAVTNTLNSTPVWMGTAAGGAGQFTYQNVLAMYLNCVEPPDICTVNKAGYAALLARQEPKQGFTVERDVSIGFEGLKLLNMYIHVDKLAPSTKFGNLLPAGLSQTTSLVPPTFTTVGSPTSQSGLPASTSVKPGEPIFCWRSQDWRFRPAESEQYNFYFTPPARSHYNPDLVVRFLRTAINFYCVNPRNQSHGYGASF